MMSTNWYQRFMLVLVVLVATATTANSSLDAAQQQEADIYFDSLMTGRALEEGYEYDYFEYDLANFSLRFDRCQYVKMYDDEMANDEDSTTPFAMKHFAVFRLCPSDSCDTCDTVYGRYVTEVEEYLEATVKEQAKSFEYMCNNCSEQCNEYGEYCSGCGKLCYRYENLEAQGYVDAADYIECQALEMPEQEEEEEAEEEEANEEEGEEDGGRRRRRRRKLDEDEEFQLYIGPRCSNDGSRIKIGLFSDQYCLEPYTDEEPEDYLGYNISYHLLAHTNSNDGSYCLSCMETDDDGNQQENNNQDEDNVNEMCETVYEDSAKCESIYGLTNGFIQSNREDGEYENQVENEFRACSYIESLLLNSYTETGEINLEGDLEVIYREMTGLQKAAVSCLAFSIVGLLLAAYLIQRKIDNSYPKVDLAIQKDAVLI